MRPAARSFWRKPRAAEPQFLRDRRGAVRQFAAVGIANTRCFRRAIVNIINLATRFAHTPAGNPAHQQRGSITKCTTTGCLNPCCRSNSPSHCACATVRGKPSNTKPKEQSGCSIRAATILRMMESGTSSTAGHQGLGLLSQRIALRDIVAEHVAGGEVRHTVALGPVPEPACLFRRPAVREK